MMSAATLKRRPAAILMTVICITAAAIVLSARPWLATPDPGAQDAAERGVAGVRLHRVASRLRCDLRTDRDVGNGDDGGRP
jgi:hypothetical protein